VTSLYDGPSNLVQLNLDIATSADLTIRSLVPRDFGSNLMISSITNIARILGPALRIYIEYC
jgi:hypothetical protein